MWMDFFGPYWIRTHSRKDVHPASQDLLPRVAAERTYTLTLAYARADVRSTGSLSAQLANVHPKWLGIDTLGQGQAALPSQGNAIPDRHAVLHVAEPRPVTDLIVVLHLPQSAADLENTLIATWQHENTS
jgi:hypothetical protein